jgi:hypothetical protein
VAGSPVLLPVRIPVWAMPITAVCAGWAVTAPAADETARIGRVGWDVRMRVLAFGRGQCVSPPLLVSLRW